jgi:hypothetical protein
MERRTESDRDMVFWALIYIYSLSQSVCMCVCVCVICAGWMRVSAVLYVAKKEFFAREISDVSRFIQKK